MRRDTYHDYVTYEELHDVKPAFIGERDIADRYVRSIKEHLIDRSGGKGVRSGRLTMVERPDLMTLEMCVSFDSRAWTGRP